MSEALESKVFNSSTDLPLVGDNLADLGDDFLQQVSSALTTAMTGATTVDGLRTALTNALNGLALNAPTNLSLTPTGGDGANLNTVTDLKSPSTWSRTKP